MLALLEIKEPLTSILILSLLVTDAGDVTGLEPPGTDAGDVTGDPGDIEFDPDDDIDSIVTLSDRVRLNFDASFTGEDLLRARLQARNIEDFDDRERA